VIHEGAVRRLDAVSRLVEALKAAERDQWRLGVYAPADCRDSVAAAAESVLGVPAYEGGAG
jgi:HD superfamily phosphohydrolase